MRDFFRRRDFLLITEEGYIVIANRSQELAVLSLREVFEFVKNLKAALHTPPFKIRLCENSFLCQEKFVFQEGTEAATEVPVSFEDIFNFIIALRENVHFALMSDVSSASKCFLLKEFSFYLLSSKVQESEAQSCLADLQSGVIDQRLSDFVAENLKKRHTEQKNIEEVLRFFLYHQKALHCLYDLNLLLKA
jgi:hypothetical protein